MAACRQHWAFKASIALHPFATGVRHIYLERFCISESAIWKIMYFCKIQNTKLTSMQIKKCKQYLFSANINQDWSVCLPTVLATTTFELIEFHGK